MRIEIALDAGNGVGEGPFWDDRESALLWVDISARRVHRWQPATGERRLWQLRDFPSAVVRREREKGLVLAMRDGVYVMEEATGALELFVAHEPDRPENRANEAKCGPDGSFWVGTMQSNLNPDGSPREMTASTGALYRIRPDRGVTREVDGVGLSNTLAWTDGGRTLLFADTLTNVISAFEVLADGSLGTSRVFSDEKLEGHCDGSAIDAEGYLWNCRFAGSSIVRFAPDGTVDRIIELPLRQPTSCCFGDHGLETLFVTSARHGFDEATLRRNPCEGAVLAIETGVRGTPSIRFAG